MLGRKGTLISSCRAGALPDGEPQIVTESLIRTAVGYLRLGNI